MERPSLFHSMPPNLPELPSHSDVGLHENTLKEALNQSRGGRLTAYAKQLAHNLDKYIKSTEQKVTVRPAALDYKLERGVRQGALDSESNRDEDRLEATIHQKWMCRDQETDFLRSADQRQVIVKYTPSSQVPLFNKGGKDGKKNWGYIDLLGCDTEKHPVVIELKILRFSKSAKPETPLRAAIEALAYAISLKKAWNEFGLQWDCAVKTKSPLAKPEQISLVVMGTTKYWDAVKKSSWISQAAEGMPPLLTAMKLVGFPCHFATIDAECDVSEKRKWEITGTAKIIQLFDT